MGEVDVKSAQREKLVHSKGQFLRRHVVYVAYKLNNL